MIRRPLVQTSQKLFLLRRKVTITACFNFPLASKRWHLSQGVHRIPHFGSELLIFLRGAMYDSVVARGGGHPVS